jgi:Carboxypeptidase regulatory-like domain
LKNLSALSLLLLILYATISAHAQSTDATISGVVVDPAGKTIPGAEIEIVNDATGVHYSSTANGTGIYSVTILPPGEYRVQVSKIGFKTLIKPGIILNVQSALALNFTLPVGAASETVTVESGSSLLNTSDASVSTVIDSKFVQNMPLNGRSFQDLISMTPGTVTQSPQAGVGSGFGDFSVNGQRTESNYYTVDGVAANIASGNGYGTAANPATSGSAPGATALGTTQSLIAVDGLQELRVQSSTYSAEYGRSPGGQFSLVTRSGTDSFHGSVFNYLRNNYFDANDWFNDYHGTPIAALRQNDFGGTAGGPIVIPNVYNGLHRTFFFVSYEGLRLMQPQPATVQYVPDNYMRLQAPVALQAILDAYPKQTSGPTDMDYGTVSNPSLATFIQSYSLPSQIDSTSGRIDQMLGSRHTLFFRYGITPSSTSSRTLSELVRSQVNSQTYTLGLTSQIGRGGANELRLGYAHSLASSEGSLDNFGGAIPVELPEAIGLGAYANPQVAFELYFASIGLSALQTLAADNNGHQWNLVETVSLTSGRHILKAGIDFRTISTTAMPASPLAESEFASSQSVLSNAADISIVEKNLSASPIFHETALFLQDEWRVSPKITLSSGLRWELNPAPSDAHGDNAYTLFGSLSDPSTLVLAPRGTSLWQTSWYNFAPRLGIAWRVRDRPKLETVIRGGGGVFFDTNNEEASSAYEEGIGFSAYQLFFGSALPFTSAQLNFGPSTTPPYTSSTIYDFPRHLQAPYTLQWNVSLEQALGSAQALTLSYVASNGRRLPGEQSLSLTALNPNFGGVAYLQSGVTSNYQSLQAQFQRRMEHGLQALASYTWSHSIDYGSTYSALPLVRGDSDFDVRNSFSAGASWDFPSGKGSKAVQAVFGQWGLDGRAICRTGFPVTLDGNFLTDSSTGNQYYSGVNLIPGRSLYLYGPQYPGGRAINGGPLASDPALVAPSGTDAGDAPRNLARGFGVKQINLAARREFKIVDHVTLQFRAEAFNVLNHPDFGYIDPYLTDATFGTATEMLNQSLGTLAAQYQQGGPRSMQFALKVIF